MPETVELIIYESWICAEIDESGMVTIKAEEQLNSSTSPPQSLPKIPSQNALDHPGLSCCGTALQSLCM